MLSGKTTFEERFWPKVDTGTDPNSCWLWTGAIKSNGYGHIGNRGGPYLMAHRASWQLHYGPIPDGLCVCHRCDVRNCVRPDHLFLGNVRENLRDMMDKGRHTPHPRLLSNEDAGKIKRRLETGESHTSISRDYPVSVASIGMIARGRTYRDVN